MENNYILDGIDREILKALQKNAKLPHLEIAKSIGISGAAVHQRIKKLEKNNILIGSTININVAALGLKTFSFVGLHVDRGDHYHKIVQELEKIPEVIECYYTTGDYAAFIKLVCKDNEHLLEILNSKIQKIKGISRTESFISLEQSINKPIPV